MKIGERGGCGGERRAGYKTEGSEGGEEVEVENE